MRQIVLDTETTGLEVSQGHRIIEIGCVEIVNRKLTGKHYHQYVNPEREVEAGAFEVHGLSNDFLADKPRFAPIAGDFYEFVKGAELIIHNAPFDLGFLNAELQRLGEEYADLKSVCSVIDTLVMARGKHPGQRNSLDALCLRYEVNNTHRELHGALLDAEILADVYLTMTGGQTTFQLAGDTGHANADGSARVEAIRRISEDREPLPVLSASEQEVAEHEIQLQAIAGKSGGKVLWRDLLEP